MDITREQYKTLRQQGYSQADIQDLAKRGRVDEELDNRTFKEKGLFRSVGGFLNMDEFGRGIGQAFFNLTGEGGEATDRIVQQQQQGTTQLIEGIRRGREEGRDVSRLETLLGEQGTDVDFQKIADAGLSNREVLGSAASTGLNVASLGGALNWGGKAVTGASSVGQATRIGATQGAIGGAAFGAAEATTEGEGLLPGAAKGAAFGAVAGGVTGGLSKYIDDLTKVTPESRLHETKDAFKTLKKKFNDNAVYTGKGQERRLISDPISTITDEGIGSRITVVDGKIRTDDARTLIRELIDEQKEEVTEAVAGSAGIRVPVSEMKKEVVSTVKKSLKGTGRTSQTLKQVDGYFDDFAADFADEAGTIATPDISLIREQMNKSFNTDTIDIERAIGDAARKIVYKNAAGSQQALAREGQLIAADKFLDALDGRTVKGGRLGGYFSNLLGAMVGSSTDIPVAGPLAGALGANQAQRFLQNQQLNPIAPRAARGIASLVEQLPTDAAGNISRTAVLNLIGQLSAQESSEQTDQGTRAENNQL